MSNRVVDTGIVVGALLLCAAIGVAGRHEDRSVWISNEKGCTIDDGHGRRPCTAAEEKQAREGAEKASHDAELARLDAEQAGQDARDAADEAPVDALQASDDAREEGLQAAAEARAQCKP